jgi:NAD(P)-dependent dehydrogenase (short-subunit alcohol dehydrogenase family)
VIYDVRASEEMIARPKMAMATFVRRMHTSMRSESLFSVDGKTAVVTGGSRGIGFMIAEAFVRNGSRCYITARKADACNAAATKLSEIGCAPCISLPADLSTDDGIASFAAALAEREGDNGIDVLVNNAGAAWGAPIGKFPGSAFDKVLAINVKAPFMLTQALLPLLREAATPEDPARVINIGSIDGIRVPEGDLSTNYSYSASKAGVHMLSRHMAHHLTTEHINVNTIAPGPFVSAMTKAADMEAWARETPLGRIGSPEDMAGAVLFLSSRAGAWLTGATLPVDGGHSTKAA